MTELHPDDKKKLGQVLGMKPSEIVAAADISDPDAAALVVETHDGKRVLLTPDDDDGATYTVTPWDGSMPGAPVLDGEAVLVGEAGPELVFRTDDGAVDLSEVPDGSAEVVLAWVGEDKNRAARALAAEQAREKPRSGVVGPLDKLAQA